MKVLHIAPDVCAGVPARMAQTLSYINVFAEVCTYDRQVDIGFDMGMLPVTAREMADDYDVLHFHNLSFYNMVKGQWPKGKKVVVTIHGLPDDQLKPGVPEGVTLHVVHAHLLTLFPTAHYLPNWILDPPFPPTFPVNTPPVLLFPIWSATRDPGSMTLITRAMGDDVNCITRNLPVARSNAEQLEDMRNVEFVYDQLRGDLGITALEAMASGAIPIVYLDPVNLKAIEEFYGIPWPLSFTDNIGETIALIKHLIRDKEKLMMVRHLCRNWWKSTHDPLRRGHQLLEMYEA